MIDLPGLQSDGTRVTHELVEKYINGRTLHKTFVLIFADPGGGDTRMLRSLCVDHIQRVQQEVGGDADSWFQTNCLGVFTKIDKKLETKSEPAEVYDQTFAQDLSKMIDVDYPDTGHIRKSLTHIAATIPEYTAMAAPRLGLILYVCAPLSRSRSQAAMVRGAESKSARTNRRDEFR